MIIPLNMRDGSIYAEGKGNEDWNMSAPHGAGRVLGRNEAKKKLIFDNFKNEMKDVYSSTVVKNVIDESPEAYKNPDDIISDTSETIRIIGIAKPLYNFKATD